MDDLSFSPIQGERVPSRRFLTLDMLASYLSISDRAAHSVGHVVRVLIGYIPRLHRPMVHDTAGMPVRLSWSVTRDFEDSHWVGVEISEDGQTRWARGKYSRWDKVHGAEWVIRVPESIVRSLTHLHEDDATRNERLYG